MDFKGITLRLRADQPADLARAAGILRSGGTVALPTETVYGLGASAFDPAAIAGIFAAKQRPSWDPLIVHVADSAMLASVAEVSPLAQKLMDAFWPGPLTLLLPRTAAIPDAVTAGRPLVGVRMPNHPVALALIASAGVPIAAPSANRFGHTSPTTAQHVLDDLDGRIHAVLDGGPTAVGVESTVVGLAGDEITIYRAGAVTLEMLEAIAGKVQFYKAAPVLDEPVESLPSPGVGIRHYAPRARLRLIAEEDFAKAVASAVAEGKKIGVMLPEGWSSGEAPFVYVWGPWGEGEALASRLFAGLRELDELGAEVILCPLPRMAGIGEALRDRLEKAARPG
ncbi:threonylcarbamoyl-AMP synthase [Granulicella sp. WH15]|uniref:L-threonylcarbamoyladenylate synthase n=1 Tax=Granulicella sp. WH15 TaxID=2602070 RepID=UPI0013677F32|nr:L-threonylcarbamoyladenylate synthase [Granulicella sp. WH15]QHN03825.1 threonylcarbamoyl-AMP synthase [Granulicella sp. WH15]